MTSSNEGSRFERRRARTWALALMLCSCGGGSGEGSGKTDAGGASGGESGAASGGDMAGSYGGRGGAGGSGGSEATGGSGGTASTTNGGTGGGAPGGSGGGSWSPGAVTEGEFVEAAADAWCQYLADCDSLREEQPTFAACREYWVDRFGGFAEISQDMGLTYEATCIDHFFRSLQAQGCGENVPWLADEEFRCSCSAYYGTLSEGEECASQIVGADGFDPCEQGLICNGTCESNCVVQVGPGESCDPFGQNGPSCDGVVSYCEVDTCIEYPGVDEPCRNTTCNGEESYCDIDSSICVPDKPRGAACERGVECETKNCEDGICASVVPFWPF